MKIIVDFRNTYNNDTALSGFTSGFWREMARSQPNHTFIFLTGHARGTAGIENVVISTVSKTGIRWLDKKILDKKLIKWQGDCFVNILPTGFAIHHLLQGRKTENVKSPQLVSLYSNADAHTLQQTFPGAGLIMLKPALPDVLTTLSWTEAESVKTQYTGDRSFFLFTGNIDGSPYLLDLLKAFSAFKKWQQSNMQLVIAGYDNSSAAAFEEKLLTYKYRTEVVVLKNPSHTELAKLAAAAYALLYPVSENIFPLALLWAIQGNKAIIASDTITNKQMTASVEWVSKSNTAEGFAKAMIAIYKDEKRQQHLVRQTSAEAPQYNRRHMLAAVWRCIEI